MVVILQCDFDMKRIFAILIFSIAAMTLQAQTSDKQQIEQLYQEMYQARQTRWPLAVYRVERFDVLAFLY